MENKNEGKVFLVTEANRSPFEVSYEEMSKKMFNPNFKDLLFRLNINEELYDNDRYITYKRIK